ncbi:hypothetical protein SAMN05216367_4912 [Tardiphaga sp. OK245]|nr:hypothetical protein SAMN05216367_4912 [Tardiphaga sp. OK245]
MDATFLAFLTTECVACSRYYGGHTDQNTNSQNDLDHPALLTNYLHDYSSGDVNFALQCSENHFDL